MKKHRFKKMYIEITNVCNLSCDFCPKNSRTQKFMSLEEFDLITTRLQGFGKFINFHVMGEPLLHPQLGNFLLVAEKKDFQVNITTNGTLINKVSEILLNSKALRQVNFSLHSFDANESSVSMEDYLENIVRFTKHALDKGDLYVSYRLWNLEDFNCNSENEKIFGFLEKSFSLDYRLKEELIEKASIKLSENLHLNLANKFDWPDIEKEEAGGRAFCYGLRDQIGVLVDGTVIPCCLDNEGTINLGNLLKQPMDEILESERVKKIYNGFSEGRAYEELCKRCGYRNRFR